MVVVVKVIKKLTDPIVSNSQKIQRKKKINFLTTLAHLFLVFIYTLFSILHFNVDKTRKGDNIVTYKIWDVWAVVGGLGDLFISLMVWQILDFKSEADLIISGQSVYEVK